MICRKHNVTPLTGKTTAGHFKRAAPGAGLNAGNRHLSVRRRKRSCAMPQRT
ncbi:hypothetical protein KCP69_21085 [Salmonella enterica subsp. enterica]|nr:hypothetical protein KCP69_21085 [Salmonella enterica subsp. enterica]